jgi:hypothetical protein
MPTASPLPRASRTELNLLDSFGHLIVNNTYDSTKLWKYVRHISGLYTSSGPGSYIPRDDPAAWLEELLKNGKPGAPVFAIDPGMVFEALRAMPQTNADVSTPNIRCGRDGYKPHPSTLTADVLAGDTVSFQPEMYYTTVSIQITLQSVEC